MENLGLPSRKKLVDGPSKSKTSGIPRPNTMSRISIASSRSSMAGVGRTSTSNGRSAGGLPRASCTDRRSSRSSIYGQNAPNMAFKKDPRPLSDKSYQQGCIKRLCSFLTEMNFPREVRPRTLQAPSTKEFIYILNFILEHLEPSLVISGFKLEEEIPFTLKYLGYPFPVSKHHLLSIGSPHSWPIMLGMLMWFMDGVQQDMTSGIMFGRNGDFDEQDRRETVFEQNNNLYRIYLEEGNDSEEFQYMVEQKKSVLKTGLKEKEEELEKLTEEQKKIETLRDELSLSSIATLQANIQEIKTNTEAEYKSLETELIPTIEVHESSTQEVVAHKEDIEAKITSAKTHISELQEHIKTQPMSANVAKKLRKEIKDKQDSLSKMYQLRDEAYQRVGELQMIHNQNVSKIDTICRQVNDGLRKLTGILPDASCITPLDYNTSKRADPGVLIQLIEQNKRIKIGLQQLTERLSSNICETERDIITTEAIKSSLQNELVKKQLEVENIEQTVEREKKSLEQAKKEHENTMRSDLAEKTKLEEQLLSLQTFIQDKSVERQLADVKASSEEEILILSGKIAEKTESLQELCVVLTQFLEAEKNEMSTFYEKYDELVSIFQKIKPPAIKSKYYTPPDPNQ